MKSGTIFNIQKFSINDGPGIRTTVFMKGCPLRCIWCHNPESNSSKREMLFNFEKCVGCRRCADACERCGHVFGEASHEYKRDKCVMCGACAEACLTDALEVVGREATVDEVIADVMRDKIFYDNSGGGMTLSGGEPMFQFEFAKALLEAAKEKGLHTCMETCGFAKSEQYREIAPLVGIFLFDYKETDPEKHKEYTGVNNELILSNLHMLDEIGAKTVLRCPIIPTLNDREDHFRGIAETANSLKNVLEINIEPYHPLGSGKAKNLGREYALDALTFPEEATVSEWMAKVASMTAVPVKKA